MSATDHLNPTQFYHGTHVALTPGKDEVKSLADQGVSPAFTKTWFTSNLSTAAHWAQRSAMQHPGSSPHVYETLPYAHESEFNEGKYEDEFYIHDRQDVLREVPKHEWPGE